MNRYQQHPLPPVRCPAKPSIKPETIEAAHGIADATAKRLRDLGCTVDITTDDNGLPVMTYAAPGAICSVVVKIEVKDPAVTS